MENMAKFFFDNVSLIPMHSKSFASKSCNRRSYKNHQPSPVFVTVFPEWWKMITVNFDLSIRKF